MGLEAATLESSIDVNLALHAQVLDSRIWEAVPVEVEATPDGQPRQPGMTTSASLTMRRR